MHSRLTDEELAAAYDLIAQAIDRAGAGQESLLLSKLALALAAGLGNLAELEAAIRVAEQGLKTDHGETTPSGKEK